MSELTQCNYDTLQSIKYRYGADNVKVVSARGSMLGGVDVLVRKDGKWEEEPVAWFMQLPAHCVC